MSRKGGSNPADDDYGDLFTNHKFAEIVAAEKAAEKTAETAEINAINDLLVEAAKKEMRKIKRTDAELIANMPYRADRNKNRHPVKVPSEWDRVDHPGENGQRQCIEEADKSKKTRKKYKTKR